MAARTTTDEGHRDAVGRDRVSHIAAYLSNSPDAVGRAPGDLARLLVGLWPNATGADLARALRVAEIMRDARLADRPTEAERLLEKTRLLFGAVSASLLVLKYETSFGLA
jgi:hypothetical protein